MAIPKIRWSAVLIVGLAALLRLLLLELKPPHFDEGVNGWFVDQITKTGSFHYDPANYHGPLHFYVLFLFQTLLGRHIWVLRLVIVIVSTATVGLVLLFERFIGRRPSEWAALAMAVSPAAVFYGRYAIHESWLVLFLILVLFGISGLWKVGTKGYLWAVALGLTGMILTKETYFIHVGCFVLAGICLRILETISPSADASPPAFQQWSWRDMGYCILTSVALIFFFYSGTLLDLKSLHGLYQTYGAWFQTGAEGHGHEKPFIYWIYPLMLRYEWTALAALAGGLYLLLPQQDRLMRYLMIYGCGALTAYSIVHYKTPWCIISLLWPFFFLFGHLLNLLGKVLPATARIVGVVLLTTATGWTITLNFFRYTDENEPYVYVQTLDDISKLTQPLNKLTTANPTNFHLTAHILLSSYHPLPWLLGDFTGIGYYGDERSPDTYDGDFLLVEQTRVEEVENALKEEYFTEPLKLRASQDPSKLYLNVTRFRSLFPNRKPEFVPKTAETPKPE